MNDRPAPLPDAAPSREPVLWHLAGLAALWLLMVLLIHPAGNFPLVDDWSFARSVQWLLEGRGLHFTGWVSMPLVTQVLWGALFCLPGGFSFTALRASTLVLGFVGVAATYLALRELRPQRHLPLIGALVLAVNPIYVVLSGTFMTDVPFAALSMTGFVLFARAARLQSSRWLVAATVMACAATLIRQVGLVLPLAFGIVWLARSRRHVLFAVAPAAVNVAVLLLYQHWLAACHGLPQEYNLRSGHLVEVLHSGIMGIARQTARHGASALVYLGLFTLPLLIVQAPGAWLAAHPKQRWWAAAFVVGAGGLMAAGLIALGRPMPVGGNLLVPTGTGPPTLRDVYLLKLPNLSAFPRGFWIAVTVATGLGAGLLLVLLGDALPRLWRGRRSAATFPAAMGLVAALGHLVPLVIAGYFDRYLLALLPPLIVGLAGRNMTRLPKAATVAAAVMLAGTLVFSVATVRDYHAWNRARWEALHFAVDDLHLPSRQIDGGFEFGGWALYDPHYKVQPNKSWWWVTDDEYMVTFGEVSGYHTIRTFPFLRWLPPGEGRIHLLQRDTRAGAASGRGT